MPTQSRLKAIYPSPAQPEHVIAPSTVTNGERPDRIGVVIDGRYRIDALIAEGGMGAVFRGRNLRLERDVAVKFLHPATSPVPQGEIRFEREAKAIARLDHPNCVSVQDFGHLEDGTLFLVMPFLEGVLLTDAIAAAPMNTERALHIAHLVLRGIVHAHAAGLVHRDIKPDNILLAVRDDDPDFPILLDFGIAKIADGEDDESQDARLTRVGQRFGTPAYMSPEQVMGTSADARSDVYSLSIVLYEMLVGEAPFAGTSEETMAMHVGAVAPSILESTTGGPFSEKIAELVAKGLAKEPGARFQSASEFLRALDACCGVREVTPAPEIVAVRAAQTSLLPERKGSTAQAKFSRLRARLPAVLRTRTAWTAVAGLVMLGVLLAVLWPSGATHVDHAKRAEELIAAGKPSKAIDYLEKQRPGISEHDDAMLQLGHAYSSLRRHGEALGAYKQAHALNQEHAANSVMQTNLLLMLDDSRDTAAGTAARFLVEDLELEEASSRIGEIASEHRQLNHRHFMLALAEELELETELDRTKSYQLDLLQEDDCETRKIAVAKLRAIGDASAISALKRARKRPKNACLRASANDAIQYLQSIEDSVTATE